MAREHTIKIFTASDIERYHKGQLSPAEMHELEKAALDDPFLADALEGYTNAAVDIAADLAALKQKLEHRNEKQNVTPMAAPRRGFPWLRIAALLVLVAGAGTLIYLFTTGQKQTKIALAPLPDKQKQESNSIPSTADSLLPKTETESDLSTTNNQPGSTKTPALQDNQPAQPGMANGENATANRAKQAIAEDEEGSDKKGQAAAKSLQLESVMVPSPAKPTADGKSDQSATVQRAQAESRDQRMSGIYMDKNREVKNNNIHYFHGQVTDVNARALPFANITNVNDSVGTYTDANGYFVLISPDSVLNVQVRSVGFENNSAVLQNDVTSNKIVLKEDNSLPENLISNQAFNSNRSRNNFVLEESEPVDGWANYDLYIANNMNVSRAAERRQTMRGQVELSFDVNEQGQPANITVVKSLCDVCDREAIRLLKEGPKWKRTTSKKRKTSVTISF